MFIFIFTRGVMIPLFPGSGSGIGIAKWLGIQIWIQIRGENHNTSIAVTNPLFISIGIRNQNRQKPLKELKSDSGAGSRAGIVTPLVRVPHHHSAYEKTRRNFEMAKASH